MIVDEWKGMYPSVWKGIITPESFSHPAKFSSRLIERIYQHSIECGWLHEGSHVIDPFGGVGLGAWPALRYGMDWTGCELEPRFVALAQANIDAWNAKYSGRLARWGTARIIQGDSRHLAQVIGAAEACISSPPYIDTPAPGYALRNTIRDEPDNPVNATYESLSYGSTPGNLGNMRPGDVDACISSPPYADGAQHTGGEDTSPEHIQGGDLRYVAYGQTPGQLAALPPGAFQAAISSPPFEATLSLSNHSDFMEKIAMQPESNRFGRNIDKSREKEDYGSSAGQLGNDSGETFWSAAREIVAQVYQVLAPGTVAIWVLKSYVKNKQLVDFPHQWQQLCEACGFVTLHEHHALLVRHGATSIDIDGNHHEKKTESKSFFRRLAEKNGSPRIDFETVLCLVKPGGEGGGWNAAISSPPFMTGDSASAQSIEGRQDKSAEWIKGNTGWATGYGQTPGQLGSLPPGSLDDATRHGGGG